MSLVTSENDSEIEGASSSENDLEIAPEKKKGKSRIKIKQRRVKKGLNSF